MNNFGGVFKFNKTVTPSVTAYMKMLILKKTPITSTSMKNTSSLTKNWRLEPSGSYSAMGSATAY